MLRQAEKELQSPVKSNLNHYIKLYYISAFHTISLYIQMPQLIAPQVKAPQIIAH